MEVTAKVNRLKQKYDDSVGEKPSCADRSDGLLLDRADKLVKGLSENERWRASIGQLQNEIGRSLVRLLPQHFCPTLPDTNTAPTLFNAILPGAQCLVTIWLHFKCNN